MDWEMKERERIESDRKERNRLLALTEEESMKESSPVWYQRMRYLREIEAQEILIKIRRSLPLQASPENKPIKKQRFELRLVTGNGKK